MSELEILREEIAVKDAEIAQLKGKICDTMETLEAYIRVVAPLEAKISRLEQKQVETKTKAWPVMIYQKALIKEAIGFLEKLIPEHCTRECGKSPCDYKAVLDDIKANGGEACPCVIWSSWVAHARGVVK